MDRTSERTEATVSENLLGEKPQDTALSSRGWKPSAFSWTWETLAMIVSFGCMVAVVAILASMQSTPLSHWTFPIALNATIAIFITTSKSMALLVIAACIAQSKWILLKSSRMPRRLQELDLFEEASRGPLGAIMLLPRVHWDSWIASIGAIATILALGIDTFAQQVVRLETVTIEVADNNVSFGLSRLYNSSAQFRRKSVDPEPFSADTAMQGAIISSIYGAASAQPFNCSLACSWKDSYSSLGFASSCANVTAATLATLDDDSDQQLNPMTTPGNVSLDALYGVDAGQSKMIVDATLASPLDTLDTIDYDSPQTIPSNILHIAVLRSSLDYEDTANRAAYLSSLDVTECTISLVAKLYSNVTATGKTFAYQVSQRPLAAGHYQNSTTPITFTQQGLPPLAIMPVALLGLAQFFSSQRFAGYYIIGATSMEQDAGIGNALYARNISAAMDAMTTSMTDHLRASYDAVAYGVRVDTVVLVTVQWAWLAMPAAVLLATALLLLATAIHSRRHHCVPWKSSAVATLYHRVVEERSDSTVVLRSELQSIGDMRDMAKRTKLILE